MIHHPTVGKMAVDHHPYHVILIVPCLPAAGVMTARTPSPSLHAYTASQNDQCDNNRHGSSRLLPLKSHSAPFSASALVPLQWQFLGICFSFTHSSLCVDAKLGITTG